MRCRTQRVPSNSEGREKLMVVRRKAFSDIVLAGSLFVASLYCQRKSIEAKLDLPLAILAP